MHINKHTIVPGSPNLMADCLRKHMAAWAGHGHISNNKENSSVTGHRLEITM